MVILILILVTESLLNIHGETFYCFVYETVRERHFDETLVSLDFFASSFTKKYRKQFYSPCYTVKLFVKLFQQVYNMVVCIERFRVSIGETVS